MKSVLGKEKLKFKGVPKKYFLIEFIASIVLAILSFVGIIYSIFDFSNYIFVSSALLILSVIGIIYYYKKFNANL